MENHDPSSSNTRDAPDVYEQIQQLFWIAVQMPSEERIPWVKQQANLDPSIARQLIAALEADAEGENDAAETSPEQPALAVTLPAASSETQRDPTPKLPSIPNYEIIEEIARGGMGVVYRARQIRPERIVAIKMMKSGAFSSPTDVVRFLNEANAASSLDHLAVVPIYEVGEINGEPFITMRFINGDTLDELLLVDRMTQTEAIQKLYIVALAIADAHAHGIIHRDLKPSNILIDRNTGQPWVTDFGLAKSLETDANLTSAGDIMGTPGYMAPEQALGNSRTVSRAADVYGLGAILYRILTGRPPIQAVDGEVARTIELIREHDVVPPRERDRRIPRALNTLCIKSLETDPALRYQHAGEFAEDLLRCLEGEAIQAKPLGLVRRIFRWCRHRPGLAATLCMLSVFGSYHILANYAGLHPDSQEFNKVVRIIIPVAAANAWLWQHCLRRTRGATWTLYAWSTGEIVLLSCVVIAGDGARSGMNPAFSLLVAASALRCRPLLVGYVSVLTMLSCAVIWGYTVFGMRQEVDPLIVMPRLLTLGLIGVIQYIALRQSSVSLESQVGETFRSGSRNQI